MDPVQGTNVRLDLAITNTDTGTPVDPSMLTCRIEDPDGHITDQTLTSGVSRLGPGLYRAIMDTAAAPGIWPYEWIVENGLSIAQDEVNVLPAIAPPAPPPGVLDVGRSQSDALRSLKRYVAQALGDDWEVRLSREEGAFERPFVRVWQVAGTTYPLTGGRWLADIAQPFVISAYPLAGDTPDDALMNAQAVEDQLFRMFRVGVGGGRALRVPLCSYNGVAMDEPGIWTPAFMRVNDLSTQPFPDPDDNTLWTVVCDVRLTWRRLAETIPESAVLTSVTVQPSAVL